MGNTQSDSSSIIHQGEVLKKCEEIRGIPFEMSAASPKKGNSSGKQT